MATMTTFDQQVEALQQWFDSPRFSGVLRLYSARQVAAQRGGIAVDYTVARETATAFHARLRELFAERRSITTFGPYSPGTQKKQIHMNADSTLQALHVYHSQ